VETGGGGGRGWKGKLKKAAETATSQGKVLAEKAKTQIGDHQAKRLEQWRTDPATRWTGESRTVASKAGVPAAIYRVTAEALWIESGLLGSKSEHVPLAQVADVDVRVGVLQRSKDIGDVVLRVEDTSGSRITGEVVVDNIEGPHHLRDLLLPLIGEARAQRIVERGNQFFPDELTDEPAGGSDLIDQLERLGQLRDAGVLTEEEFAAQKSRLLGG
jgi:hypothetical protein